MRFLPYHAATFAALFLVSNVADATTPVAKVLQLLSGMAEKGKKAKHDEEVEWADRKQWCDAHITTEKRNIMSEEERIALLEAEINKETSDAQRLGKEIRTAESDISVWEGDIEAAQKVRNIEKEDFAATLKDYTVAIESLQRAIVVLKKQDRDVEQASLLQVASSRLVPDEAKRSIEALLQTSTETDEDDEEDDEEVVTQPKAHAYEGQSGGIIDMMEKLLDKFIEEKTAIEKEEANKKHAFTMLKQDLLNQIALAKDDKTDKSETKLGKLHDKAQDESDERETEKERTVDKRSLAEISADCQQRAQEFEARQEMRAQEIEAIEKAIEILDSGAVKGNAEKHLGLAQTNDDQSEPSQPVSDNQNAVIAQLLESSAFAQLRSKYHSPAQDRVVQFLQQRAGELKSRVLSAVALRVMDDPFTKVKKMIKDLVVRLMEEANEEAEHKGWCDTEMTNNQQTREEKTTSVEKLHAAIDELSSAISQLTEQLGQLQESVSELTTTMAEATKMRNAEKEKAKETIKDAQDAQTAVAQALVVLKEFYEQAGEATSFLQISSRDPYGGMQSENTGVVGMLEVIQSDFARLEAETTAGEASASKEYEDFMQNSQVDKATKESTIKHKTASKQDAEQDLAGQKNDLEGTQKELDTAMEYYEKLKPSCVDSGVSYEDRVNRRKEEIESLQEALKVLNGEDIAL